MKRYILILISFLLIFRLYASNDKKHNLKSISDVKDFSVSVVKLVKDNKIEEAFKLLKENWILPEYEVDKLEVQTAKQLAMVAPTYGKAIDYLLVDEKDIKGSFLKLEYVIKYEYHITRWIFIFYKPQDEWLLNSFLWDDKITELF